MYNRDVVQLAVLVPPAACHPKQMSATAMQFMPDGKGTVRGHGWGTRLHTSCMQPDPPATRHTRQHQPHQIQTTRAGTHPSGEQHTTRETKLLTSRLSIFCVLAATVQMILKSFGSGVRRHPTKTILACVHPIGYLFSSVFNVVVQANHQLTKMSIVYIL